MSQEQRSVDMHFLDGAVEIAVATGNNAASTCRCGTVVVGYSDRIDSTHDSSRIECERCGRAYRVVAAKKWGPVIEVREVKRIA